MEIAIESTMNSTNLEIQVAVQIVDSSNTSQQLPTVISAQYNRPNLEFLEDTREAMDNFLKLCVPLHKLSLEGNWAASKHILDQDPRLRNAGIAKGWPTMLHVAAGANQCQFVEELLKLMDEEEDYSDLALQDMKGNTAFVFAAAAGNMRIVELMLQRESKLVTIRGGEGVTPLQFAAMQGRCIMAWYLFDITKHVFQIRDWDLLFFTCINTSNYDLALKMAREREELAFARDTSANGETGLHLLAQKPLDRCCEIHDQHETPIRINPGMKQHVILQLVNFLWKTILSKKHSKKEIRDIISEPSQLLFDAAEVGNFGFLSELISAYPSLIWEVDKKNRSLIHVAVLHRHASIFNLIHEIGPQKDIIVTYEEDIDKNTLLHLAAKLAPPTQLELVSGAAFQMSLEISWFEEVNKIMPPSYRRMKNSEALTASELFTREHAELRSKGESWIKGTAESCMLISTVIATCVLSAAIQLPGGNGSDGKPNYLQNLSFLIFAISDATAFISSATSILIFMSILVSRYAEYDFHKSLPIKLIFGLIMLFISITSMMVAFSSIFFIIYCYGLKWVPSFISIFACLPIFLFMFLQFSLWSDIIYSTYYCRTLFKPGVKMLYVLEK
ncbi:putative ankyrin repeat-containing domain, PGG domain-containing protein [Lupinus albus]|uniref:Putative ankyrin repeat-containing domain, PGG domain-containing protein n=1 Tax=Lupinus albus TaxID=3870 RepID=A0A6A4NUA4_LUPAL|nr:putative ankyrin repeat-containing domain, PGG domain-containing protein [Lupinus albus]